MSGRTCSTPTDAWAQNAARVPWRATIARNSLHELAEALDGHRVVLDERDRLARPGTPCSSGSPALRSFHALSIAPASVWSLHRPSGATASQRRELAVASLAPHARVAPKYSTYSTPSVRRRAVAGIRST
jgi:hypothetical protein